MCKKTNFSFNNTLNYIVISHSTDHSNNFTVHATFSLSQNNFCLFLDTEIVLRCYFKICVAICYSMFHSVTHQHIHVQTQTHTHTHTHSWRVFITLT